jgi:hypothetical protein
MVTLFLVDANWPGLPAKASRVVPATVQVPTKRASRDPSYLTHSDFNSVQGRGGLAGGLKSTGLQAGAFHLFRFIDHFIVINSPNLTSFGTYKGEASLPSRL